MECKLTYLYPDLLNLYGDRGNVAAAARTAEKMGVAFSFERVDDFDTPIDFAGSDLLLFSPGELSTFPRIIERLERDRAALEEYIESGKYILAIGGAACIFADVVNRVFRPSYQGLGLGLYDCAEREAAYGDDLIFTCSPAGTERKVAGQSDSDDRSAAEERVRSVRTSSLRLRKQSHRRGGNPVQKPDRNQHPRPAAGEKPLGVCRHSPRHSDKKGG